MALLHASLFGTLIIKSAYVETLYVLIALVVVLKKPQMQVNLCVFLWQSTNAYRLNEAIDTKVLCVLGLLLNNSVYLGL